MAQQGFREEEDEWLSKVTVYLSSENVEVISGCSWINDLHVTILVLAFNLLRRRESMRMVVAELQETLEPSTRMLWTLTIVAMGQIHYQASTLQPLAFPRCDELVNNALGIVGKVAELGFPDSEEVGRYEGVPEFEAQRAILRE